jgi:hypothetical protein
MIRLGLGIIAGGSIVFFPNLFTSNMVFTANESEQASLNFELGRTAAAFIFGYAVDIFYAVLDRIGGKEITGD